MSHHTLLQRRQLLQSAAGLAIAQFALSASAGRSESNKPLPAIQTSPPTNVAVASTTSAMTPGKPGDFNFLAGEWKIHHRKRKANGKDAWDTFEGEATCWTILDGVGSVEELRIPARKFSGMGLRLLDIEKSLWSDFWVNARSGVLTTPGTTGSFEDGEGIFIVDDVDGDQPIKIRGVWDRITQTSCRWHQGISRDGGKTWQEDWLMDWVRA